MIKEEKDFFTLFNIYKKINNIKSNFNNEDLKKIEKLKTIKKYDNKNEHFFSQLIFYITCLSFVSISIYYKKNDIENFFNEYFNFVFFDYFWAFYTLIYGTAALYSLFFTVYAIFTILNKTFIKYLKLKINYKKNKKDNYSTILFNNFSDLLSIIKTKSFNINNFINLFNKEEIDILNEHDISFFDNEHIYYRLIKFLDDKIMAEDESSIIKFNNEIEYLTNKSNSDFKEINLNNSSYINNILLYNKFNKNIICNNDKKLVSNF